MPTDESQFLGELHVEVEAELTMAIASDADEALTGTQSEWLYDPTDVEREEIGLQNLLGAVEALASGSPPDHEVD